MCTPARAGKLVWFGAADNRGHAALDAFGILPGYRGTLVRDDYPAYAKYDKDLAAVQLCCAHLLRSLRGIGEMDTDPFREQRCWTEPAAKALTDAKAAVAKAKTDGNTALDPDLLTELRNRYDKARSKRCIRSGVALPAASASCHEFLRSTGASNPKR